MISKKQAKKTKSRRSSYFLRFTYSRAGKQLPNEKKFCTFDSVIDPDSIKNMREFYEEWCSYVNRQPMAGGLPIDETLLFTEIRQLLDAELDWSDFLNVPFTHHIEILRHCKSVNERIFYIHQCAARDWSKYVLLDFMKQDLYGNRGNLPSNFTDAIPDKVLAVRTVKAFKENYFLVFINAEDLYESDDERNEPLLHARQRGHGNGRKRRARGRDYGG